MLFKNLVFILPSFQQFLLKRILLFSHKMVFIKNEAALLCVTMPERARVSMCSYNLVYNFLLYLLPLKSSVFMVNFLNAFWHGNEAFPKGSSQNEITPFLLNFHLLCSKYRGAKICFYSCRYQIKIFHSCRTGVVHVALVSHSCCSCSTRVALVSHWCCSCLSRATLKSLASHSCCIRVARVLHLCQTRSVLKYQLFQHSYVCSLL